MFKNVDYSFKEYVNEQESNLEVHKKTIYSYKNDEASIVARVYPEIEGIDLFERTPKELIYNVTFSLSNQKKRRYQCEISMTIKNKSIKFLEKTFDDCIDDNRDIIRNIRLYRPLCRRYFKYVLLNELKQFDDYAFLTGWEGDKTDKRYISVNCDGGWDERYRDLKIFSGFIFDNEKNLKCQIQRVQSELHGLSESDVIDYTQQFSLLFRYVMDCQELMGIFAYTIHSLLWYYCADGNGTWTPLVPRSPICQSVFSICIYGKKINDLKCISNIFSNIFYVDMLKEKNSRPSHAISSTSLNNRFLTWRRWHSIPVIVTNRSYNLTRNSSIVKTIHKYRQTGGLYFFPVYLNNHPLNADENEDFNIDHVMAMFESPDDFQLLKDEVSYLLLVFVLYISSISEDCYHKDIEYQKDFNYIHRIYQNTIQSLKDTDCFNQEEQMNFALLYSAIRAFCRFLKSYMKFDTIAEQLEQQAYRFFIKDIYAEDTPLTENTNSVIDNSIDILTVFHHYLEYLFSIPESERTFMYYIENEKRGEQEICYYLESKSFYKHFSTWNSTYTHINITESKLKQILRDSDLLIMRSNGKQYASERWHIFNGESKKYSLLIIRKTKFEELIGIVSH